MDGKDLEARPGEAAGADAGTGGGAYYGAGSKRSGWGVARWMIVEYTL